MTHQRKRPSGRRMPKGWVHTVRLVVARDKGICHLCGKPGATSADHVIPHAKGGSDDMANLKAAHIRCNEAKNASMQKPIPKASRFDG